MFLRRNRNIDKFSDLELIALYKKSSDNDALSVLFKRYSHLIYGVCLKYFKDREQAKDMVMQVCEKLLKDLKKHDIKNFKSWLHVLTKNECLMLLRKEKKKGEVNLDVINGEAFMEYQLPYHHNNEESIEEDFAKLETCIGKLRDEQQQCIKLFYLERKSYEEVVSITGFELKKVKSYIQNGRRNLKICIQNLREQEA